MRGREPRTVCEGARRVLEAATRGLEIGQERTIDRSGGRFMPLVVARLPDVSRWQVFVAAHRFVQRDEPRALARPAADPCVTLLRTPGGAWLPADLETPLVRLRPIAIEADRVRVVDGPALRKLVTFCELWMHHLRHQQRLDAATAESGEVPGIASFEAYRRA